MKPSRKNKKRNKMPITPALHTLSESIAITHKIYDSIMRANMPMSVLMTLGKCVYAKIEWKDLPVIVDSPSTTMQLALVEAVDKFLMPDLSKAFITKNQENLPTKLANSHTQRINSPSEKSSQTKTEHSRKINSQSRKPKRPKTERARKKK